MAIKHLLQRIKIPRFSIGSLMWLSLVVAVALLWYKDHERLSYDLAQSQGRSRGQSWSVDQVRGPPNTQPFADAITAWASESQNGEIEWIIAEYPETMDVTEVHVYETFCPGALYKIAAVSMTGSESVLWEGKDPVFQNTVVPGRVEIKLTQPVRTRRIKLYLNSPAVDGWNEIDAIGLLDKQGQTQWASNAWASTSYGLNRTPSSWYWP